MNQSENHGTPKQTDSGPFVSFVLLERCQWDMEQYIREAREQWGIEVSSQSGRDDTLVWEQDGMLATVSLMCAPVPGGEAEHNAATNYLWPEAV